MAERTRPVAIPAPVAELVEAWTVRSADRFAAALAPDVRVSVPPLHLDLTGRDDVWDGVARLFGAFGALRYTSRHRYLSPDAVTDEVLLEGLQTREFLGAPPSGQPGAVAARVLMRHDGRQVTALTVWPDVAALRDLSDGVTRRIDLRAGGSAAHAVAALRATIPAAEGKLSVGHQRQVATEPPAELATLLPGAPPVSVPPRAGAVPVRGGNKQGEKKDRAAPKAPLPRTTRRLRALAAGVVMLALAGLLVAYVVQGVKGVKGADDDPVAAAPARPTRSAVAPSRPASSPTARRRPPSTAAPTFDPARNTFRFTNTVLFERNRFTLRAVARRSLEDVARFLVAEKRYGVVEVDGYTDDTGTAAHNDELSLRRAGVVRAYLESRLGTRFTLRARGFGESHPVARGTDEPSREKNRRVEIVVPDKSK